MIGQGREGVALLAMSGEGTCIAGNGEEGELCLNAESKNGANDSLGCWHEAVVVAFVIGGGCGTKEIVWRRTTSCRGISSSTEGIAAVATKLRS